MTHWDWEKIATFVIAGLLSVDRFRTWMHSRESADANVVKEIEALRGSWREEMSRLEAEVKALRTSLHTLRDAVQADRVKIAVLESKVESM